eukprot:scpid87818/ scgid29951/ 
MLVHCHERSSSFSLLNRRHAVAPNTSQTVKQQRTHASKSIVQKIILCSKLSEVLEHEPDDPYREVLTFRSSFRSTTTTSKSTAACRLRMCSRVTGNRSSNTKEFQ